MPILISAPMLLFLAGIYICICFLYILILKIEFEKIFQSNFLCLGKIAVVHLLGMDAIYVFQFCNSVYIYIYIQNVICKDH